MPAKNFYFTNQGIAGETQNLNDSNGFDETINAFRILGKFGYYFF